MKVLKDFINESIIIEGRSVLDQPEWGEASDIKYIEAALNKMEKMPSLTIMQITSTKPERSSEVFEIFRSMMSCARSIVDDCIDNDELPESKQDEFGAFGNYNEFKKTGWYERVIDNYEEEFEDKNADTYVKLVCSKWDDICKKATGNYWW